MPWRSARPRLFEDLTQLIDAAKPRHLIPIHTRFPDVYINICPSTIEEMNYGQALRL